MNYTTEDAIALWRKVQDDIREHGHETAFNNANIGQDPELVALTLTLCVSAAGPLSQ